MYISAYLSIYYPDCFGAQQSRGSRAARQIGMGGAGGGLRERRVARDAGDGWNVGRPRGGVPPRSLLLPRPAQRILQLGASSGRLLLGTADDG